MLGDREPPFGDDVGENHHDGELPEVGLLLFLSIRERYVFLLLGTNEETTTRLQKGCRASEFGVFFFALDRENMGGL